MSRHTAVLEKSFGSREHVERALISRTTSAAHRPCAFTGLIARLFGGPEPLRVVAFVSALPQEGVTYTTRRAAEELERTTGLRVAVAGAAELFARASAATIRILGAPAPANGTEHGDRLAELRRNFDVVLIDAGSVKGNGAVVGLAGKTDAVVVVVEAGRSSRQEVGAAVETVAAAGGNIAGLVLNKQRARIPAWLERQLG